MENQGNELLAQGSYESAITFYRVAQASYKQLGLTELADGIDKRWKLPRPELQQRKRRRQRRRSRNQNKDVEGETDGRKHEPVYLYPESQSGSDGETYLQTE